MQLQVHTYSIWRLRPNVASGTGSQTHKLITQHGLQRICQIQTKYTLSHLPTLLQDSYTSGTPSALISTHRLCACHSTLHAVRTTKSFLMQVCLFSREWPILSPHIYGHACRAPSLRPSHPPEVVHSARYHRTLSKTSWTRIPGIRRDEEQSRSRKKRLEREPSLVSKATSMTWKAQHYSP